MREVLLSPVCAAITFWDGMNRLVGDLVLPPWEGPHPVAVFVDGYGPGGRDQGTWQQRLAAAGIASLAYDKPGCGESTGDWTRQTLEDRGGGVDPARRSGADRHRRADDRRRKRARDHPAGLDAAAYGL